MRLQTSVRQKSERAQSCLSWPANRRTSDCYPWRKVAWWKSRSLAAMVPKINEVTMPRTNIASSASGSEKPLLFNVDHAVGRVRRPALLPGGLTGHLLLPRHRDVKSIERAHLTQALGLP